MPWRWIPRSNLHGMQNRMQPPPLKNVGNFSARHYGVRISAFGRDKVANILAFSFSLRSAWWPRATTFVPELCSASSRQIIPISELSACVSEEPMPAVTVPGSHPSRSIRELESEGDDEI
jgi:hypothetical protein